MQKEILLYDQYGEMVNKLIKKIEKIKFTAIFGILRGGLPIAVHISHRLNIPLVKDIYQYHFEYIRDRKDTDDRNLLIVDDIVDTGKTLKTIQQVTKGLEINHYVFATLYKRPIVPVEPDYYVEESSNWLIFPWELIDELPSEYHQKTYTDLFGGVA